MSRLIPLRGKRGIGKFAIIDDEDYEWASQKKWCVNTSGYPVTYVTVGKKKQMAVLLHREVLGLVYNDGLEVDHKNRNRLDARQENLRLCSDGKNQLNKNAYKNSSSRYKGVSFIQRRRLWFVHIQTKGNDVSGGYFKEEYIAALKYDQLAREYHGEFACLNFPDNNDYSLVDKYLHDNESLRLSKKTSKYPNVHKSPYNKWIARYTLNGKYVHIGSFFTEEDAYMAVLQKIKERDECK